MDGIVFDRMTGWDRINRSNRMIWIGQDKRDE
jgi:hypothetical protein